MTTITKLVRDYWNTNPGDDLTSSKATRKLAEIGAQVVALCIKLDNASYTEKRDLLESAFGLLAYDEPKTVQAWDGEKFVVLRLPSSNERSQSENTSAVAPFSLTDDNGDDVFSEWFSQSTGYVKIDYFATLEVAREFAHYGFDDRPKIREFPPHEIYINNAFSNTVESIEPGDDEDDDDEDE